VTSPRFDIRSYTFDSATSYFIDANVWLDVYGPVGPGRARSIVYSEGLKRLRISGAKIFVDVLVTSEIMNRWARIEYARAGGDQLFHNFKAFRLGPQFRVVAADIVLALRAILAVAKRTGTPFANINFDPVLDTFVSGGIDLTDQLIAEACRSKKYVLITHDGDMKQIDVPIVSANANLLT
jgi:predicted nucleic acid-binding protein